MSKHEGIAIDHERARKLLLRAAIIAAVYGLLHLVGGRACAGFLSGTPVGSDGAVVLGCAYVVLHFLFVLVAPILVIAAGILSILTVLRSRGIS